MHEACQEEVKTREERCNTNELQVNNKRVAQTHVDREFSEIRVGRGARHYSQNKVVKITVCRTDKLYGAEVDIVKCLVFNTECFVRVLHEVGERKA